VVKRDFQDLTGEQWCHKLQTLFVTNQAIFVGPLKTDGWAKYSVPEMSAHQTSKRSPLGQRIASARQAAGLSQQRLAEKLNVTQQMVGYLEQNPVAIRPELLLQLSQILNISADELLGRPTKAKRKSGPPSRIEKLTEKLNDLPREKQRAVIEILAGYLRTADKAA